MDRAFASGSSASPPSAPGSPSIGYPTAGNPGSGTPATKPGPYWYYMITEELRAIVAAAGLTPAQGTLDQVLQALPAALASRPEMAKSLVANGYQKLPGGFIVQWGYTTTNGSGQAAVTFPISFPTALLRAIINPIAGNHTVGTQNSGTVSGFNHNIVVANTAGIAASGVGVGWIAFGY